MPNRRVATTFKCRWRPNRSRRRVFTVNDASRICCKVVRERKGTFQEIENQFNRICQPQAVRRQSDQPPPSTDLVVVSQSVDVLDTNQQLLFESLRLLRTVAFILRAIVALIRFVPRGRALQPGAIVAERSVQAHINALELRTASNRQWLEFWREYLRRRGTRQVPRGE